MAGGARSRPCKSGHAVAPRSNGKPTALVALAEARRKGDGADDGRSATMPMPMLWKGRALAERGGGVLGIIIPPGSTSATVHRPSAWQLVSQPTGCCTS
jgi:hypothetical protein